MKKVILLDENIYICNALREILPQSYEPRELVAEFNDIEVLKSELPLLEYDVLIMEPKGYSYNFHESMHFIQYFQRNYGYEKKLIVLTTIPKEIFFLLLDGCFVSSVIGKSISMSKLKYQLDEVMNHWGKHMFPPSVLTSSESQVLKAIISGRSLYEISRYRECSPKTVSHHKRSGLKKLGVNSIQALLASV